MNSTQNADIDITLEKRLYDITLPEEVVDVKYENVKYEFDKAEARSQLEDFYEQVDGEVLDDVFEVKDEADGGVAFEIKPHKCRYCNLTFSRRDGLQRHMKVHSNNVTLHQCNECSKSFIRSDGLKSHIRTHRNEKTLKCKYCDR